MAVTQDDIDTLLGAIAQGHSSVRLADGRQVVYRSVAELRDALALLRGELDDGRTTYAETSRE